MDKGRRGSRVWRGALMAAARCQVIDGSEQDGCVQSFKYSLIYIVKLRFLSIFVEYHV